MGSFIGGCPCIARDGRRSRRTRQRDSGWPGAGRSGPLSPSRPGVGSRGPRPPRAARDGGPALDAAFVRAVAWRRGEDESGTHREMNRRALCAAVLAVACSAAFGRTALHGFLFWDDRAFIAENPLIAHPSAASLLALWTTPLHDLYAPLTYTLWGLLAAVFGPKPWAFHLTNVALHTLNAALVFAVLRRLVTEDDGRAALAGALLFAVHPDRRSRSTRRGPALRGARLAAAGDRSGCAHVLSRQARPAAASHPGLRTHLAVGGLERRPGLHVDPGRGASRRWVGSPSEAALDGRRGRSLRRSAPAGPRSRAVRLPVLRQCPGSLPVSRDDRPGPWPCVRLCEARTARSAHPRSPRARDPARLEFPVRLALEGRRHALRPYARGESAQLHGPQQPGADARRRGTVRGRALPLSRGARGGSGWAGRAEQHRERPLQGREVRRGHSPLRRRHRAPLTGGGAGQDGRPDAPQPG